MSEPAALSGLHFWVRDIQATLAFYRAVGLEIGELPDPDFLNFELPNGLTLAFGTYDLTRRYDPGFVEPASDSKGCVALQFTLDSRAAVDDMHARLIALGHTSHLPPFDAFWRNRYCEVSDPDGNVVGFHGSDS